MNGIESNQPGRKVFWSNGNTEIIRYCHGVFGLEHEGRAVMPETTFERAQAYAWAEFIDLK